MQGQTAAPDGGLVIGYLEAAGESADTAETVETLRTYLQGQLATPVTMHGFTEETKLFDWLTRFQLVDAAWLGRDRLATVPIGELFSIARNPDPAARLFRGKLVAHRAVDAKLCEQLTTILVGMEQAEAGRAILTRLQIERFEGPAKGLPAEPKVWTVTPTSTQAVATQMASATPAKARRTMETTSSAAYTPAARSAAIVAMPQADLPEAVSTPATPAKPRRATETPVPATYAPASRSAAIVAMPQADLPGAVSTPATPAKPRRAPEAAPPASYTPASRSTAIVAMPQADLPGAVSTPATPAKPRRATETPVPTTYAPASRSAAIVAMPQAELSRTVSSPAKPASPARPAGSEPAQPLRLKEEPLVETAVTDAPAPSAPTPPAPRPPAPITAKTAPAQAAETPAAASPPAQPDPPVTERVPTPRTTTGPTGHSLPELFERSVVPVIVNVEPSFLSDLTQSGVIEDGPARKDMETDVLESIQASRSFNRDSLAALARTEQAAAQTKQAFAQLLPNATVRYSRGEETSKPSVETDELTGELIDKSTHTRTDLAFLVRQPLFDLPSYLDWRRRGVLEQARDENYRVSAGDAYLSTVNAYLSLVSTRLQSEVTRDFEAQLLELFDYIEKRANAGAVSESDMARVAARREATLSFRLQQESAHTTAWLEFVRLTNIAPEQVRLPKLDDFGASLLPPSFDKAVSTALRYNPEVAALKAELAAERVNQDAAQSRYLPRLGLEYSYNYSQYAGGDPDPDGQKDNRIMAVLDWELFSGGRDYYYHRERAARYKELQYKLDDEQRRIVEALSSNYASLATTRTRITSGYQELKEISTASEAMSKRMLTGNQSLLDLLDVYDRLFRARSRLIELHVQEMNTVAQLVRLTLGTPWQEASGMAATPPRN